MASGFIILKDGRCFARRWTGYDGIIQVVINELQLIDKGQDLSDWLKLQIPSSTKEEEDTDAGWGFYNFRMDQWINRELDLRSLTQANQELFLEAIKKGKENLILKGSDYSSLSPDFFEEFYVMCDLAEKGQPPMEKTDWTKLADACTEQNGPGWEK